MGFRIYFSFDMGGHWDMTSVCVGFEVCFGTTLSSGATRTHRERITFCAKCVVKINPI